MPSQLSKWIAMASVRAKGKRAERVRERVCEGKCLIEGCKLPPTRRGLCTRHYYLFRATLIRKGDQGPEFEERAIEAGLVLPVGQVRELKHPNPFDVS